MRNLTSFCMVLLCSVNLTFSQSNFSESFSYFPKNIHVHVPSLACLNDAFQSNMTYKAYIGKFSVIRTYYADVNVNLGGIKATNGIKHIVGVGLYNDREGDFFSKTRVLSRYAIHIPLREEMFLSMGTAFHLVNYRFSASASGATGSDIDWTGSIATSLNAKSYALAISFNDFNNPKIRPINYNFSIYRYLTLYGEKTFDLNANTQIRGSGKCNLVFGHTSTYLAQLGLVLSNLVGVNGFYYVNRGWGLAFDINAIKIQKSCLDFSIAYQIPTRNASPPVNQYEINLKYYIKKQE